MNGPGWAAVYTLVGSMGAAILIFLGTVFTAYRKGKSDDKAIFETKSVKIEEANATVRVALVQDRDAWESRVVARLTSVEDEVEKERAMRRAMEDKLQDNKLRIAELENHVQKLQSEKVIASKDYQDKITEQDITNHRLQSELQAQETKHKAEIAALEGKCNRLEQEYAQIVAICNDLRQQLEVARTHEVSGVRFGDK